MAPRLIFCYMSIVNNLIITQFELFHITRSVSMDPKYNVIMRLMCSAFANALHVHKGVIFPLSTAEGKYDGFVVEYQTLNQGFMGSNPY